MSEGARRVETPENCVSRVQTAEELKVLAQSRVPADRERLLVAIVDLCATTGYGVTTQPTEDLLGAVLMRLVEGAEQDIRLAWRRSSRTPSGHRTP